MQAGGSTIGWTKDNKYEMKHKAADREDGLRVELWSCAVPQKQWTTMYVGATVIADSESNQIHILHEDLSCHSALHTDSTPIEQTVS